MNTSGANRCANTHGGVGGLPLYTLHINAFSLFLSSRRKQFAMEMRRAGEVGIKKPSEVIRGFNYSLSDWGEASYKVDCVKLFAGFVCARLTFLTRLY